MKQKSLTELVGASALFSVLILFAVTRSIKVDAQKKLVEYESVYTKAAAYATAQFGDRREPLTAEEKQEWFRYMHFTPCADHAKPSVDDLRAYSASHRVLSSTD